MSKLRKSANGQQCQIRIPEVCLNRKTVVLCHLNGAGMAMKHLDIFAAYGCQDCHDVVDGRIKSGWDSDLIKLWFLEGVIRTQEIMAKAGLIKF